MKANTNPPLRIDPAVVAVLQARARRARSEYVNGLVGRLFHKLTPNFDLTFRGIHWG